MSHYGVVLGGWNNTVEAENAECQLTNVWATKQHLRTNYRYGPGHVVYSFSERLTVDNINDSKTVIGYSEEVTAVSTASDTLTVEFGRFRDGSAGSGVADPTGATSSVTLSSTGTLPAPLQPNTKYTVTSVTGNQLSLNNLDGTPVDLTSEGSGTITMALASSMAGHTVKVRENSTGKDVSGVNVSNVYSECPGGLLQLTDVVNQPSCTNMVWRNRDPDWLPATAGGGGIVRLDGTETTTGIQGSQIDINLYDEYGKDTKFINLRGSFANISGIIRTTASGPTTEPILNLTYASNNKLDLTIREEGTSEDNLRDLVTFDRDCRANTINVTTGDSGQGRSFGGDVNIVATTTKP